MSSPAMTAKSPSQTPGLGANQSASLSQDDLNFMEALGASEHEAMTSRSDHGGERSRPQPAPQAADLPANPALRRKGLTHILARSRSIRTDEPQQPRRGGHLLDERQPSRERINITNPKTAPLAPERGFRDAMSSESRNRSADRTVVTESDDESLPHSSAARAPSGGQPSIYSNLVQNSARAATGLGKASKGLFGKFTRTGSGTGERGGAITPTGSESHVFRVIDLPLIEQTRKTRIKKSLKGAGDKTEFWMPALPYRCIDYLNSNGVDSEGLYRVPGSNKEVREWKIRFDSPPHYDVDLLTDGLELYDINIVGSMLKDWLRNLPEPLFPKATQSRIADQCAGATRTPQLMRDELSRLPPFNYYLLFALTCHISLLHSHAEQNKMNYNNLCICFQPCIQLDAFCFQFLVMDWRNCWQGCWTEAEFYQQELELMKQQAEEESAKPPPRRPAQLPQSPKLASAGPAQRERDQASWRRPTPVGNGSTDNRPRGGSNGSAAKLDASASKRSKSHSPSRKLPSSAGAPSSSSSAAKKESASAAPFAQDMGPPNSGKRTGAAPTLGPVSPVSPMHM